MSKQSVFCIVAYITRANYIVDRLKFANFPDGEISVLFPTSAVPPTQISGALGWLASISTPVPEIGPFIVTGPMRALAGFSAGAEVAGIFGGLLGTGLAEPEARRLEERIREGNILLSIHTERRRGILLAKKIFEQSGAQDICFVGDDSSLENLAGRRSHLLGIASRAACSWSPGPVAPLRAIQANAHRKFLPRNLHGFTSARVQIALLESSAFGPPNR